MMAREKTKERAATAADRTPKQLARSATLTAEQIAHRAYDLYVARGCEDGHDVDDWLQAEVELSSSSA